MKILFLFPYPKSSAASQRFRFEQYIDILEKEGHSVELQAFLSKRYWANFYKRGFFIQKAIGLLRGFIRRIRILFKIWSFDYVFVHRETTPIGPPIFEWLMVKVLNRKIIYDFDDAIWLANSSDNNRFFAWLKWHSNAFSISKWSYKVSVGNQYLANKIQSLNDQVVVNPTTIDTIGLHNRMTDHSNEIPVLGWTGSHSTIKYLEPIFPIIAKLKSELEFKFVIISDEAPVGNEELYEFIQWDIQKEIDDLLTFNVGIMPLTKDDWSEGKCGFKALQYMSLGIPSLVSPVGVNEIIVDDGLNGFICRSDSDWEDKIKQLLNERDLCLKMGISARKKVEEAYSVNSNTANFLNLFS